MHIKLSDIATYLRVDYTTFSRFVSGQLRSELMCRRMGDFVGRPWLEMLDKSPEAVEALALHSYLEKKYSSLWGKPQNCECDYEKASGECA